MTPETTTEVDNGEAPPRDNLVRAVVLIDSQLNTFAAMRNELTGWVFGPTFTDVTECESFIHWLWFNYAREPHDMDGHALSNYVDYYRGLIDILPGYSIKLGSYCIVEGDLPCTRQVVVVRSITPAGKDGPTIESTEAIAELPAQPNDLVIVDYVCKTALLGESSVLVRDPSAYGLHLVENERSRYHLASKLQPVNTFGIQLRSRHEVIEYEIADKEMRYASGWIHVNQLDPFDAQPLVDFRNVRSLNEWVAIEFSSGPTDLDTGESVNAAALDTGDADVVESVNQTPEPLIDVEVSLADSEAARRMQDAEPDITRLADEHGTTPDVGGGERHPF